MEKRKSEKVLSQATQSIKLLERVKEKAQICFSDANELEVIIERIDELEQFFKPFDIEFRRIKEAEQRLKAENKKICEEKGHVGEWEEETYYIKTYIDHEPVDYPMKRWTRKCTRCGKKVVSETKPTEVVEAEKQKRIMELEEELKKIKVLES